MADQQPPKKRSRFSKIFGKAREVTARQVSSTSNESAAESSGIIGDDQSHESTHQEINQSAANQQASNSEHEPSDPIKSPISTTAALAKLTVQDRRRQGIYGLEALGVPANNQSSVFAQPALSAQPPNVYPLPHNFIPENLQHDPSHRMLRKHNEKPQPERIHGNRPQHGTSRSADEIDVASRQASRVSVNPSSTRVAPNTSGTDHSGTSFNPQTIPPEKASLPDNIARLRPLTSDLRTPNIRPMGVVGFRHIDVDRDQDGKLLPVQSQPYLLAPQHRLGSLKTRQRPNDNQYTSPERVKSASETARFNLKRKRTLDILPPPAFVYVRSNDPAFNIFAAFKLYPELCFLLAKQMPLKDLINLYSMDKDFHTIIDTRFTTVCLDQAISKAPESAKIFHFRSYKQFCRTDPVARIPHPDPAKAERDTPRTIPSFRWVRMVIYREKLIHEVMAVFAERGVPLPVRCALAMKRMWYLMDMPNNALRIGAIHNHNIVTDLDLYFAMAFFVKLDMLCNSPVAVEKRDGLRKLMLSMPDGFTTVHRVLTRQRWQHKTDVAIAWVRHTLNIPELLENPNATPEELGVSTIFKVPVREVGLLKYEYWGRRGLNRPLNPITGERPRWQILLRPDQLVMREAVRRGLRFHKHIMRSVLYGYTRPDNLENYLPRNWPRRIPEYDDEEYGINDPVGGIRALSLEEGGDPLLDLGNTRKGSKWTHVQEDPAQLALEIQKSEEAFMKCIEWWASVEEKKQDRDDLPDFEECMAAEN